jgi:hypothetical protein
VVRLLLCNHLAVAALDHITAGIKTKKNNPNWLGFLSQSAYGNIKSHRI